MQGVKDGFQKLGDISNQVDDGRGVILRSGREQDVTEGASIKG